MRILICLLLMVTALLWFYSQDESQVQLTQTQRPHQKKMKPKSKLSQKRQKKLDSKKDLTKVLSPLPSIIVKSAPKWQKLATQKILRFLPQGTSAEIKDLQTYYQKRGQNTQAIHEVEVSLTLPNGRHSRYKALIEPHTGNILITWDRTRYEFATHKTLIAPSGTL